MCNNSSEYKVVMQLKRCGFHISFAESCTGGLCAARLISVPDASAVLDASVITYSNQSKTDYLGVNPDTVERFGVVSEEVALEMAEGVSLKNNADVGVGVTGIAGPTGGSADKPVGTVCFGFKVREKTYAVTKHFSNIDRNAVRNASADYVFDELLRLIQHKMT